MRKVNLEIEIENYLKINAISNKKDLVLIIDFGSQVTKLITEELEI